MNLAKSNLERRQIQRLLFRSRKLGEDCSETEASGFFLFGVASPTQLPPPVQSSPSIDYNRRVLTRHEFQIEAVDHRSRLDAFLQKKFPHLSRMYLREAVRDGLCEVNGRHENRGIELRSGDFVEIEIDTARHTTLLPEEIPFGIVFEDDSMVVVEKPSGMLVHPTVGVRSGTLLNALAHHLNTDTNDGDVFKRAGLVHRLDKDTSGLVVIAKTHQAHRVLCSHFQRKWVEKRYFAVVDGIVESDSGEIDAPIGRFEAERVWGVRDDGKPSSTRFRVVARGADCSLMELEPVTGRTNQLRIHLSHIGHPITGDTKYGGREFPRLCLHSALLKFKHPADGRVLEFQTGVPADFPSV